MNEFHAELCSSGEWAASLHEDVIVPLTRRIELGKRMLEIGPGPGAATRWLSELVSELTVLEVDPVTAERLEERFAGGNVSVVVGDATSLDFEEDSFDSVGAFTMLHHVPTESAQNRILAEAYRVLRPGGVFLGSDSRASTALHDFHIGDVYNPIEPASLLTRLSTVGFRCFSIDVEHHTVVFAAHKKDDPECEE